MDYKKHESDTDSKKLKIQKEIINFINDNDITEFGDLVISCKKINKKDWLNVILNYSTVPLNAYINSRRHVKNNK